MVISTAAVLTVVRNDIRITIRMIIGMMMMRLDVGAQGSSSGLTRVLFGAVLYSRL